MVGGGLMCNYFICNIFLTFAPVSDSSKVGD